MYELDALLGRPDRLRRGCPSLWQRWRQLQSQHPQLTLSGVQGGHYSWATVVSPFVSPQEASVVPGLNRLRPRSVSGPAIVMTVAVVVALCTLIHRKPALLGVEPGSSQQMYWMAGDCCRRGLISWGFIIC